MRGSANHVGAGPASPESMWLLVTAERARRWRWLALGLMVLGGVVRIACAGVHMDLARDMFIAWRSLHGEPLPLSGPVLAGTIHLGPVWYWLLDLLLVLGRGWLGAVLGLGLLASTQYPLAYLAGKELHGRAAGMLWACGLLIPSWSAFEWVLPLHYLLSSTCVLAVIVCAARYWRRPRLRYLIGMGLGGVLALHAHPANAGILWVVAALAIASWRRGALPWRHVVIAATVALLPLLPYLFWDAAHGFADLRAGAHYLGGGEHTGHWGSALPLLLATAIGGTWYWFVAIVGWSPPWAGLATAVIGACGGAGLVGASMALRNARTRNLMLVAIATALAIGLTTALLRDMTPYYMTTALRVALAGIIGIGLACLGAGAWARSIQSAAVGVATASFAVCAASAAHLQKHGAWPFNFFPLFDVVQPLQPTMPLALMPAYGVAASGAFLCELPAPSAHGAFAQYLLHGYAIDMRLACDRHDVKLGGADPQREHWLGLSRALFTRIGVRPERRLGSLGLVHAQPLANGPGIDPPATPIYPAYLPAFAASERVLHFKPGTGAHVAVSNVAFGFAGNPQVQVKIGGVHVDAQAHDAVSAVYACPDCGAGADIEVTLTSSDIDDVDIVAF